MSLKLLLLRKISTQENWLIIKVNKVCFGL